ncbi:hypothetical protein [Cupriavidus metallidurans]|uniref:hypothetical protein n=1 Tax=Cupriavidus metallidurans TaxID=119219 RepID=UPI001CCB978A|nr:hypothetical protein [Cupriavidus metallidurans]UBM08050.1 hypothetical protein LAI70_10160 [Cupriavidus metallidurans]
MAQTHKVLYLDDDVTCPTGYRNTGEPGGTLSIIGKTAVTRAAGGSLPPSPRCRSPAVAAGQRP